MSLTPQSDCSELRRITTDRRTRTDGTDREPERDTDGQPGHENEAKQTTAVLPRWEHEDQ